MQINKCPHLTPLEMFFDSLGGDEDVLCTAVVMVAVGHAIVFSVSVLSNNFFVSEISSRFKSLETMLHRSTSTSRSGLADGTMVK